MGRRALYQAIRAPSTSISEINERHDIVSELLIETTLRTRLRELLALSRFRKLTALLASSKINPRGLAHIRDTLSHLEKLYLS